MIILSTATCDLIDMWSNWRRWESR